MIRKRITFANVTSFVALFVALSAGSYAAVTLPANSVGSKQIKAKAVTSAKLRNGAVTGSKLRSNAVDSSKVKNGSLTGSDINLATLGKVPSAATADSAGSAPIARVKQVTAGGTNAPADPSTGFSLASAVATCDSGLTVVGGGVSVGDRVNQAVVDSYPSSTSAWTASVYNDGTGTPAFTVYAICAPAASTS